MLGKILFLVPVLALAGALTVDYKPLQICDDFFQAASTPADFEECIKTGAWRTDDVIDVESSPLEGDLAICEQGLAGMFRMLQSGSAKFVTDQQFKDEVCLQLQDQKKCNDMYDNYSEHAVAMMATGVTPGQVCRLMASQYVPTPEPISDVDALLDSECNSSPDYVCGDVRRALICKKFNSCMKYHWGLDLPLSVDDNSYECQECKSMAQEVKDALANNQTVESIVKTVENVCERFASEDECKEYIEAYLPSIISSFENDMTVDQMCSLAGMCKSDSQDSTAVRNPVYLVGGNECTNSLTNICQDFQLAKRCGHFDNCLERVWKVADQAQGVSSISGEVECEGCKLLFDLVDKELQRESTEEDITGEAEKLCQFCPNSTECTNFLETHLPELIQLASETLSADYACALLQVCQLSEPEPLPTDGLLGADDCVVSLDVLCADYENAKDCGALEMCEKYVWKDEVKDITCPGGQDTCPDSSTCCKTESSDYGCCPLPNAVCCSDLVHCCPSGYICSANGYCESSSARHPLLDVVMKKDKMIDMLPLPEPEIHVDSSMDGIVCAQSIEVQCANYEMAKKCGSLEMCKLVWKAAVKDVTDVTCPGGQDVCADGNTCCKTTGGSYGCCPVPNAVCCSDMVHCCPSGYTCAAGGFCEAGTTLHPLLEIVMKNQKTPVMPMPRQRRYAYGDYDYDYDYGEGLVNKARDFMMRIYGHIGAQLSEHFVGTTCKACKFIMTHNLHDLPGSGEDLMTMPEKMQEAACNYTQEEDCISVDNVWSLLQVAEQYPEDACTVTALCASPLSDPYSVLSSLPKIGCEIYQSLFDHMSDDETFADLTIDVEQIKMNQPIIGLVLSNALQHAEDVDMTAVNPKQLFMNTVAQDNIFLENCQFKEYEDYSY